MVKTSKKGAGCTNAGEDIDPEYVLSICAETGLPLIERKFLKSWVSGENAHFWHCNEPFADLPPPFPISDT